MAHKEVKEEMRTKLLAQNFVAKDDEAPRIVGDQRSDARYAQEMRGPAPRR